MREIALQTDRHTQLIEITDRVREALGDSNGATAALVYVPHTTAGVAINERIDPELVLDLEKRGLLDRTLVVIASEFSRDMMIEGVPGSTARDQSRAKSDVVKQPIHYGLHRHFTGSGSVLLFGGGMKKGYLYGETARERPLLVTKNPISIADLHATILAAMGIAPRTAFEVEKRPFYVTQDGKGRPVRDLFARTA